MIAMSYWKLTDSYKCQASHKTGGTIRVRDQLILDLVSWNLKIRAIGRTLYYTIPIND